MNAPTNPKQLQAAPDTVTTGPIAGSQKIYAAVPERADIRVPLREITLSENPRWSVPILDFAGVPTGIDVTRVCRTGILPQINTGMAGRVAGTGQVGAGLVTPPAEIFPQALTALAAHARRVAGS